MGDETFVEEAKRVLLYEHQAGSDIGSMLDQSDTNSRVSEAMIPVLLLFSQMQVTWKGKYKGVAGDLGSLIQRLYLNVDAFARTQAIAMNKAKVPQGVGEEPKKKGILGMLGVGK